MVKELKRWKTTDRIFWLIFLLVIFFGFLDSQQIIPFHQLNSDEAWSLYQTHTAPAWITIWVLFIAIIGLVYYWLVKDKSESIGLVIAGWIMLWAGLEDVGFFIFSKEPVTSCMSWFNEVGHLNSYLSTHILRETCVSPLAMYLTAFIGVVVAYYAYKKLKRM